MRVLLSTSIVILAAFLLPDEGYAEESKANATAAEPSMSFSATVEPRDDNPNVGSPPGDGRAQIGSSPESVSRDRSEGSAIVGRIERLENDAREAVRSQQEVLDKLEVYRPTAFDKYVTAGVALVSSILGGFIAFLIQSTRLRFDREAAQQAAGVKELAETYRYRSRQLNEGCQLLFGPVRTLVVHESRLHRGMHPA